MTCDDITLPREVVKLALEALEFYRSGEDYSPTPASEAITALRAALAAPTAEDSLTVEEALRRENERLRDELRHSSIDHTRAEVERLREEIAALKEERRKDMAEICSLRESEESLREEVERLQNTKHHEAPFGFTLNPDYLVPELIDENKRLREENERYRWLQANALSIDLVFDPDNFVRVWVGTDPAQVFRGRTLDDAVGEAMKEAALRQEEAK